MDLQLRDRVAIVTGGSAGIGYAIAKVLAAEGANVVIAARRPDVLQHAAESLSTVAGRHVVGIPVDTTDQSAVDGLVATVCAKLSRIDILVNCAATPAGRVKGPIEELDADALLEDLNTKVVGYARCCKAVVPVMRRTGWGRIVNIGGLTGRGSSNVSGMRNVAICHLTKTLSDQLGPSGITVNAVHPGLIRTPHLTELFASEAMKRSCKPADVEAQYVAGSPIRRILEPEEVAYAVAYLASPIGEAITGESIAVDAGITRGVYL